MELKDKLVVSWSWSQKALREELLEELKRKGRPSSSLRDEKHCVPARSWMSESADRLSEGMSCFPGGKNSTGGRAAVQRGSGGAGVISCHTQPGAGLRCWRCWQGSQIHPAFETLFAPHGISLETMISFFTGQHFRNHLKK